MNQHSPSFWNYACQVYQRPGVESCLLSLQNQYGLVINHLLVIAWLDGQGRTLSWGSLVLAEQQSGVLSRLISPLRGYRMQSKAQVEDCIYQQLKALELDAERLHIDWLEGYCQQHAVPNCRPDSGRAGVEQGVRDYLSAIDLTRVDAASDKDEVLCSLIKDFSCSVTG
ncbi:TIGR02444 family protein [Litoribrevibacter euphylliae]|uniref:TIGR02444 family protein n=1 Tax=Litoribrevibacter euphylliae TaxID=1834034 RepID=A0ABV7HK12_9GAMM